MRDTKWEHCEVQIDKAVEALRVALIDDSPPSVSVESMPTSGRFASTLVSGVTLSMSFKHAGYPGWSFGNA